MVSLSSFGIARDFSKSKSTSISYGALITTPSDVCKKTENGISELTCILSVGKCNSKVKSSGRIDSSVPTEISANPCFSFIDAVIVVLPFTPVVISNFAYSAFSENMIFAGTEAIDVLSEVNITSTSTGLFIETPFLFKK